MNSDRNPNMVWEVLSEIMNDYKDFSTDFELKLIGKVDASILNEISKYKLTENVNI